MLVKITCELASNNVQCKFSCHSQMYSIDTESVHSIHADKFHYMQSNADKFIYMQSENSSCTSSKNVLWRVKSWDKIANAGICPSKQPKCIEAWMV